MADIAISSGHGKFVRGARGVLDEVDEARRVVNRVAELLRTAKIGVSVFHDDNSRNVSTNLSTIIGWHNRQKRDRDISCHFNAFKATSNPMGAEVCHKTQQSLATKISTAIATAGGLINRGHKRRTNLSFLNRVTKPAVLLEVCFVDSSADANLYRKNFEGICRAIAESIADVTLPSQPRLEPPGPSPQLPAKPEISGDNIIDVHIAVTGDASVFINGDAINEDTSVNKLEMTLDHTGDVIISVNDEDFQVPKD